MLINTPMSKTQRALFQSPRPLKKRRIVKSDVRRAVRSLQESKYFNSAISHITATASTTALSAVTPGDGAEQRDGRKILLTGVEVMGMCNDYHTTRVVIYVPKKSSDDLTLASVYSAIDNDAYWVLYDDWVTDTLHDTTVSFTQGTFHIKLNRRLTIEFEDGSNNPIKNPVKMLIRNSSSESVYGFGKIWYKDI